MTIQEEFELERFKKFNKGQKEFFGKLNDMCFDECGMPLRQFITMYDETKAKLLELEQN